jgi:hypothetical protein
MDRTAAGLTVPFAGATNIERDDHVTPLTSVEVTANSTRLSGATPFTWMDRCASERDVDGVTRSVIGVLASARVWPKAAARIASRTTHLRMISQCEGSNEIRPRNGQAHPACGG